MARTQNNLKIDLNRASPIWDSQDRHTRKVLVVDDRVENLVATRKILKKIDAEVFEADSGNKALSLMLRHEFAVVLLDVQMPEMDGFEVAKLVHEEEKTKDVPIIFVTALSKEEHYVDRAAEIGAVDYIYKPINSNILISKVQVFVDLFSQKQELKKLNEALRQNNDELERFAYICSHDLQEPARITALYSELIKKNYGEQIGESGRTYLDFIIKESLHMRKMVTDILKFSRVGREPLEYEAIDANLIVKNIIDEFKIDIEAKGATVELFPLPSINSSPTLLSVLIRNLMSNSLKYQDGKKAPKISVKAEEKPSHWLFSFSDNGIGIDPKYTDKVFQAFSRVHGKSEYPGTGIGLSTCKKFIELFGGRIWFTSDLNQGATFFFTIPKTHNHP